LWVVLENPVTMLGLYPESYLPRSIAKIKRPAEQFLPIAKSSLVGFTTRLDSHHYAVSPGGSDVKSKIEPPTRFNPTLYARPECGLRNSDTASFLDVVSKFLSRSGVNVAVCGTKNSLVVQYYGLTFVATLISSVLSNQIT
jgi:hypothetical protein